MPGVITMVMIGKVRRMHRREKKSVREIARATSLSRNTVRKWLRRPLDGEPRYRRTSQPGKLTPFHEALKLALEADAHRPRQGRRSARALHAELRATGYLGGYTRVTDFIRAWREAQGQAALKNAFVPLEFALGEAFQFDWSEEGLVVGGIYYRLQVSHMKLCSSRAFWLVAYPSQGHETLFDAHTRSFVAMGGIARRGIYDNMKTAVDKVKKGKGRVANARFAGMCARTTCSKRSSATLPPDGRRGGWRRMCRTAGGGSGSTPGGSASARLCNSTPGSARVAGRCGRKFATPSIGTSASPRCSSTSRRT